MTQVWLIKSAAWGKHALLWSTSDFVILDLFCLTTAPAHPSLFFIFKDILIALFNDSAFVLDMPVLYHHLLFKHETVRDRVNFKPIRNTCAQRVASLIHYGSWLSALHPRKPKSHQLQVPVQIYNRSLNSSKQRTRQAIYIYIFFFPSFLNSA